MSKPILWHIPISHYNEKARWALEWKGIEHERRAPPPPANMIVSAWYTRGASKTFPLLQLDGEAIGDSTAIIAALEERWPEPPLYPADPAERRRALELEGFFDEELGPHLRLLAWHELRRDPAGLTELSVSMLPGPLRGLPGTREVARRFASGFVQLRFRVASEEAAALAREKVLAALDRLDSELEVAGEHLVGDRFSVADLTAAALFYPLVAPPEGPRLPTPTAAYEGFRAPLRSRPGYQWVERTYARYRRGGAGP